jgi:hypothetical protein
MDLHFISKQPEASGQQPVSSGYKSKDFLLD